MSDGQRFVVAAGMEFNYPADAMSLALVQRAGGRSRLPEADRARVKFKTVTGGVDCTDMPADVRELYVERGWVLVNETPDQAPAVAVVTETEDETDG